MAWVFLGSRRRRFKVVCCLRLGIGRNFRRENKKFFLNDFRDNCSVSLCLGVAG